MKFIKSRDERAYDKARRRLDSVSLPQAFDWANSVLWSVQEGLEKGAGETLAIQQARDNTVALLAALDSLLDRME